MSNVRFPLAVRRHLFAKFVLAATVLLAGVIVLSIAGEGSMSPAVGPSPLAAAPLLLVVAVAFVVPFLEALVWSFAFVEASRRFVRSPVLGAVLGVVAYSAIYHRAAGLWGMVASAWVGGVVNAMYLHVRSDSWRVALLFAVGLRWCFVVFAVALLRGWLPAEVREPNPSIERTVVGEPPTAAHVER